MRLLQSYGACCLATDTQLGIEQRVKTSHQAHNDTCSAAGRQTELFHLTDVKT